jgi:hypothetical protein
MIPETERPFGIGVSACLRLDNIGLGIACYKGLENGIFEQDEREIRARDRTCVYCGILMKQDPETEYQSGNCDCGSRIHRMACHGFGNLASTTLMHGARTKLWPWNSFSFYANKGAGLIRIDPFR